LKRLLGRGLGGSRRSSEAKKDQDCSIHANEVLVPMSEPRMDGRAAETRGAMPQWRFSVLRGRFKVRLLGKRNQPGANPDDEPVARERSVGYPEHDVDGLGLFGVDLEPVE
jgi:hypothetical protein